MFQGKIFEQKSSRLQHKIFAICKCFFFFCKQIDYFKALPLTLLPSDNTAKYISKPKSQARIYLSNQLRNTERLRIATCHHVQRVWTDPIFCNIRKCNETEGIGCPIPELFTAGRMCRWAIWTKGNHIPISGSSDAQNNFPVSNISVTR